MRESFNGGNYIWRCIDGEKLERYIHNDYEGDHPQVNRLHKVVKAIKGVGDRFYQLSDDGKIIEVDCYIPVYGGEVKVTTGYAVIALESLDDGVLESVVTTLIDSAMGDHLNK